MSQQNNENKFESIVLEEEIENYEPTREEIIEYAGYLGMDIENEKELLWIARNGLKAPLPNGWKPCQTQDEEIYYFNFETGESRWDHPCDEQFRKLYLDEKQKLYQRKAQTTFQLKDIAAEPITEDDFEDELETCERKKNVRKSERGINTTQRSSKEGERTNKDNYNMYQKKQDESNFQNSAIEDITQKENVDSNRNQQYLSDKKYQKNFNSILNESKLHLTKSPANLTSSLCTSTIEDPSQLFNNPSMNAKSNNLQSGQKYFNSVKKQLDDCNESRSIVVQNKDTYVNQQNEQLLQQKKEEIDKEILNQLHSTKTKLESEFQKFQQELEKNLENQKQEIIKMYSERIAQSKLIKEREQVSKKNKILEEIEQFQHNEILSQQEQLQKYLSNVKHNYEETTNIYEEEVEQICISKIEQLESEIKDLKQMKEEQEKGIQNIEKDHQDVLKGQQQDFEKQKVEVNSKIQEQIKNAIEKEQKNFEKDLESFQIIWEQQFQIQELSAVEEEAFRQTTKLEFEKKYKDYQMDLSREQENKRHHVFDRIRKEEIISFEKNKMKKKQEYELILEEKKLEVQKLLASQETLFEKEVKQLDNKQKEKYDEFLNTQVRQLESRIQQLEQEKISLIEQIQREEPFCSDINNLDIELHSIISNLQNTIDELNDRKNKQSEDIYRYTKNLEEMQRQKQEQDIVLNDINLQILNQENVNQQIAFQQTIHQKNLEDDKKAEKRLKQTIDQFRSINPLNNYFSGNNSANGNLFAGEQNSFGYRIDESSILNNEDAQNNTEIDKLQKEVEELKTLIQKEENNYQIEQNYYSNKENNGVENIEKWQDNRKRMDKKSNIENENLGNNNTIKYATIQNDKDYNEFVIKREQLLKDRKQFLNMQQQNLIQGQSPNDSLTQNILQMMDSKISKVNIKIKQYEQEFKSGYKNNIPRNKIKQFSAKKNFYERSQQEELEEEQIQMEGFSRIM